MPQLVVIAEAEIDPAATRRFREIGERMILASRREPGCITYAYSIDLLDASRLRVIEIWASEAALREHFATPHMAEFRRDLAASGARIASLRVVELGKEGRLPA